MCVEDFLKNPQFLKRLSAVQNNLNLKTSDDPSNGAFSPHENAKDFRFKIAINSGYDDPYEKLLHDSFMERGCNMIVSRKH